MVYQTAPFSITLKYPKPRSRSGYFSFDAEYLRNG